MQSNNSLKADVVKSLDEVSRSIEDCLDKIDQFRKRIVVKDTINDKTRVLELLTEEARWIDKPTNPLYDDFIDRYLQKEFGYQTLLKIKEQLANQVSLAKDDKLAYVDLFQKSNQQI